MLTPHSLHLQSTHFEVVEGVGQLSYGLDVQLLCLTQEFLVEAPNIVQRL